MGHCDIMVLKRDKNTFKTLKKYTLKPRVKPFLLVSNIQNSNLSLWTKTNLLGHALPNKAFGLRRGEITRTTKDTKILE